MTHNHINHCNDINAVIDAMTYGGFDKKGVLVANKTVINGFLNHQPFLQKYYKNCLERFVILEAGRKVGINNIEVIAIKAKHSEPNAIGFKFITPDYAITYSGDTCYNEEMVHAYKNSNILILNVPYLKKEENDDNLCKEDAIKIIKKTNPKLAIITHFGSSMLKAEPLYEAKEIQKETNVKVIAATDGMVINPISYDIVHEQKPLYKYDAKEMVRLHEFEQEESVKEVNELIEDSEANDDNK